MAEQIYMFEIFVKRIELKIEPYVKDAYELEQEEIARKKEEERRAALEALKKPKKGKKPKKPKKPKKKKGKKGKKGPVGPSEEELKLMQTCTVQMRCLPVFDFLIAHDNFIAPPPPPPPPKKKKGKKGKKKPKPKPKKKKKGKKKKPPAFKRELPSEPLPQPPYFGVGNTLIFVSRPSTLEDILRRTPIYVTVWNREENFECIGFCNVHWHESFFECIQKSAELNPAIMDQTEFRDTSKPIIMTNTVELLRPLRCEHNFVASGEVHFFIRLSCLGNKVLSSFIQLPEMERIPGRKYIVDDWKLKDLEVVRHWLGTVIEDVPPVAYFYGAPDIMRNPIIPEEELHVYEEFTVPYTSSELAILAMGFPKGPCGGINCPKRMDYRGSQHKFIPGEYIRLGKDEKRYQHGLYVNERDVHGPCGRLDCPLAKKVRAYICNEGAYKTCKKPCPKDYY
ncbi:hypothetical protein O0L34_g2934 [Tuta absoluta]|nr:hypothetical protein O0L34_g2934 [Tuta absoluta]